MVKVAAYFLCYNEEYILPHLLRHYLEFCDSITIYDNYSTDRSRDIVESFPNCQVRMFDSGSTIRDDIYLNIKNNCWKEQRGKSDFVIVGDADEFLYHPKMNDFLRQSMEDSVEIFRPEGYHMIGDLDLNLKSQDNILEQVQYGIRNHCNDKLMMFNPDIIHEMNYLPGCHMANPKVNSPIYVYDSSDYEEPKLKLLHYKYLGLNDFIPKQKSRGERLSQFNKDHGLGMYYLFSAEKHIEEYNSFVEKRVKVI